MFKFPFAVLLLSSVLTTAALSREPRKEAKDAAAPDHVRCKKDEGTGTLIARKVCRTNAEWKALADASSRDARDSLERSAAGSFQSSSQ